MKIVAQEDFGPAIDASDIDDLGIGYACSDRYW